MKHRSSIYETSGALSRRAFNGRETAAARDATAQVEAIRKKHGAAGLKRLVTAAQKAILRRYDSEDQPSTASPNQDMPSGPPGAAFGV